MDKYKLVNIEHKIENMLSEATMKVSFKSSQTNRIFTRHFLFDLTKVAQ